MICRICLDDEQQDTMVAPCLCTGTSQYIHQHCLDRYLTYYPDRICRVCRAEMLGPWSRQDKALFAIVLIGLGTTLTGSAMSFGTKGLIGLGLLGLSAYFVRNNIFNQTVALGTLMIYVTFVHGGHPHAVITLLTVVSGVAAITTLFLYIPVVYVVTVAVTLTTFAYLLVTSIAFAQGSDGYGLAVFMCLLYMGWYAWVRAHPPLRFRNE